MDTSSFEKLGAFYLGRVFDLDTGEATPEPLLYDSKDLVTHAVCLGMTGSGKTGLCIGLLEEAAIDGVPAIIIDPKGDLANLLLTFPELGADDFRPWINEEDAARKGLGADEYAAQQAEAWRTGLAEWGQDGARIAKLRGAADVTVYTPGSEAGIPVSVVGSFAAPAQAVRDDAELLSDRVSATVSGLLGLVGGSESDPVRSREHILLSTILSRAWAEGRDLDLAGLIQQIQAPPVTQVGVMAVDSFFPPKDRFELAMAVNNLLASPGFATWMQGEPLDAGAFLRTADGRPRLSIFSIAHLGDAERMFFVTLLLGEVLAWTRSQAGTTSLRAIVYMDEIAGYLPPVAAPPSKAPMLTMLKQARAFGVGVVLATQNPVDLDYKALSNIGTWWLGRLQTERDVDRVLDGLEGAAAGAGRGFEREDFRRIITGLGKRVFLMNNVHDDGPEVFQTRWTMSYLRGPLTRTQLKELTRGRTPAPVPAAATPATPPAPAAPASAAPPVAATAAPPAAPARPVLPPDVPQYFLPAGGAYAPLVYGSVTVAFTDARAGLDEERRLSLLTPVTDAPVPVDWSQAQPTDVEPSGLDREPADGATFRPLPSAAGKAASYAKWQRDLVAWVASTQQIELLRSPGSKLVSAPGEAERDFRARVQQASREGRDAAVERVREKYQSRLVTLQERIRKAEQAVEREREQAQDAKLQTAVSFGATVVGALFGGRRRLGSLGRATTAVRGASRSVKQHQDVARAQETVAALNEQLTDLESELEAELAAAGAAADPATETLETVTVRPKKTGISVHLVALVWGPAGA